MAEELKGLKKLRVSGASRRAEWNRPNRKAEARLNARLADYEKTGKQAQEGFKRPGSMKCY